MAAEDNLMGFFFYVLFVYPAVSWVLKPGRFSPRKGLTYAIILLLSIASVKVRRKDFDRRSVRACLADAMAHQYPSARASAISAHTRTRSSRALIARFVSFSSSRLVTRRAMPGGGITLPQTFAEVVGRGPNHYALLGVTRASSATEIKRAYKKLSLEVRRRGKAAAWSALSALVVDIFFGGLPPPPPLVGVLVGWFWAPVTGDWIRESARADVPRFLPSLLPPFPAADYKNLRRAWRGSLSPSTAARRAGAGGLAGPPNGSTDCAQWRPVLLIRAGASGPILWTRRSRSSHDRRSLRGTYTKARTCDLCAGSRVLAPRRARTHLPLGILTPVETPLNERPNATSRRTTPARAFALLFLAHFTCARQVT